ncbi:MAG: hypothetical protein KAK00_08245 [Nanoarchaeota archaeon]|nr:hypothetical protein [Nanoarchaeota archaeon]
MYNPFEGILGKSYSKISSKYRQHGHFARVIKKLGARMHSEIGKLDQEIDKVGKDEDNRDAKKLTEDTEKTTKTSGVLTKYCKLIRHETLNIDLLTIADLRKLFIEIDKIEKKGFNQRQADQLKIEIKQALAEIAKEADNAGNILLSVAAEARKSA